MYYTRRILRHALNPWCVCSRASTSAREYALSCSGRRHLDDCMFQQSEHGRHETEIVDICDIYEFRSLKDCVDTANEYNLIVLVDRNNEEAEATSR